MKTRGMGSIVRRGRVYWVAYWYRGKQYRESAGSTVRADAVKLLRRRQAEMSRGQLNRDAERVGFDQLVQLITADYRVNERKSLARVRGDVAHLREHFGRERAVDITAARVSAYIAARLEAGAAPATIKHEVGALGRMFTLAYRDGLVPNRPPFPSIAVRNVRSGFVGDAELRTLLEHLPPYMRPFTEFAYFTGWRRGEIRSLTWRQVDFRAGTVRLEPGTTKNDEGRVFPFSVHPRLKEILEEQRRATSALAAERGAVIPWVFHRNGHQVAWPYDSWRTACREAGLPGLLLHDMRRSAVRNLERAGVPRSWAMKLTGHKTESVYRRYAIVCEADLSAGVAKLAALHPGVAQTGLVIPLRKAAGERTGTEPAQSRARIAEAGAEVIAPQREDWRPQRDSNSCYRRERAVS